MAICTTAKVVMDGVFQRGETYYLWHCVITGFVSLKSGSRENFCLFAETIS